jgi:hypothetical protein
MMRNTPEIRPARAGDAAGIASTLRDLGWFAHIEGEPVEATVERVARQLAHCAANDDHTVLVAEEGQIVGYLAAHWFPNLLKGGDGYISEFFIREVMDTPPCTVARIQAVQPIRRCCDSGQM